MAGSPALHKYTAERSSPDNNRNKILWIIKVYQRDRVLLESAVLSEPPGPPETTAAGAQQVGDKIRNVDTDVS
jgi:hypothetical protein